MSNEIQQATHAEVLKLIDEPAHRDYWQQKSGARFVLLARDPRNGGRRKPLGLITVQSTAEMIRRAAAN